MTADDFRIRKLGERFRIEQLEAGRWVPLYAEVYGSREEAQRVIDGWTR